MLKLVNTRYDCLFYCVKLPVTVLSFFLCVPRMDFLFKMLVIFPDIVFLESWGMCTCVHVCVQVPQYVFRDRRSASRLVLAFHLAQQCLHRLGDPRVCPALVVSAALAPVGSQECNLAWVLRTQTQLLTLHGKRFPPESALQACLLLCLSVCSFFKI